jgi:phosphate starvation-inducible protein PhoH and related proteins
MSEQSVVQRVSLDHVEGLQGLFGGLDENLDWLERQYGVQITVRDEQIVVRGEPAAVDRMVALLKDYDRRAREGQAPTFDELRTAVQMEQDDNGSREDVREEIRETLSGRYTFQFERKRVTPKGAGQQAYVKAIVESSLSFGIGPAGTGKTYLAMACAMDALFKKKVQRIILARPAVEAGESLGFLPGDLQEKVNPYLRPLYDALYDIIDLDKATRLLQKGIIEVAPIAYMRGRTLNDSFVILDEAQNTTADQMKMFLTRLGFHSKAVVTGDVTQIDLPPGKTSGLIHARQVLGNIPEIRFIHLTEHDVVRHPLVRVIIEAYARADEDRPAPGSGR